MRCSSVRRLAWLVTTSLAITSIANAAVLTGRVVDSAGRPVAGAEVRIWQKLPAVDGRGVSDQPVEFDGVDTLITDAEGKFTSPDVLMGEAMARMVVEAHGTLAERSGWIEIPNGATVVAPEIVLRRLRAVLGEVRDRKGRPVERAIVFNSGDGHRRVETRTGRSGKFFLDGVPEGPLFLFVEKPGYRFTGKHLPAGQSEAAFMLAAVDEAVEPLPSLPPLLTEEEEISLAREVLSAWHNELRRQSTDEQKFFYLAAIAAIDPLEALEGIAAVGIESPMMQSVSRDGFLMVAAARSNELPADKLREALESASQPFTKASQYAKAARYLAGRQRQLEWLNASLACAPHIENEPLRLEALAIAADAYSSLGERKRAEAVLANAEEIAEKLPDDIRQLDVYGYLALATADTDAGHAVKLLDKMKGHSDYARHGAELALRLLPKQPDLAEEVWRRTSASSYVPGSTDLVPLPRQSWAYAPDFCYRLAQIDRGRAERVAEAVERAALRVRAKGAIALALSAKEPAEARRMFESLVREELPRLAEEDEKFAGRWEARPSTAAWLLPVAERVAPSVSRELLWRSLALRLRRPRYDHFDETIELSDLRLAPMLARYDRDLAGALIEPLAARAVRMTAAAGTDLKTPHTLQAAALATRFGRELAIAAVHVDPRRARKLVERMPYGQHEAKFSPIEYARQVFVWVLARHGAERWSEENEVGAGFWRPRDGQ